MELRDFAQQVLFATTLEAKLKSPLTITDDHPGPAMLTPRVPGRPADLCFKPQGSGKAGFPGLRQLDREDERGRLLHFFANHELLATELMALALLRFPDAPASFRRGVCQTLKDEQLHTRLYLDRMRQCGIEFGEIPVSGYFWRAVSSMESPMDYVVTLCLTFEQANLDFCRDFARGFQAVGDADTAGLLDRIYNDEIGHVAYGLRWFRRWKDPDQSDWDAFCRRLKFPLSPQRAKGLTLNVEGRRAAGLDPAFIAHLEVYSQSKGRTPNVFVFNPFTEGHIAHGKGFTPVNHQTMLAADLANLPQFLSRSDDIVLLAKRPSIGFLTAVKRAGFPLPEFVELNEGRIDPSSGFGGRKLGSLRPWAWGPDSLELLQPLFSQAAGDTLSASQRFNAGISRLYSKAWSASFLGTVLAARGRRSGETLAPDGESHGPAAPEPWLCTEREVGVAVNTVTDALEAIAAIRRRGHHRVVAKEALGLAGHNAIRLWEPEVLPAQLRWIAQAVRNGRQLVIEPWLEREADFSVQLEMGPAHLKLCGYTGLVNDPKGQFLANWVAPGYNRRIPASVIALFNGPVNISDRLHRLYSDIFALLEAELRRTGFVGPLGIDAFVYRTPEGGRQLKPIVEINPRYTMGRLALELMRQTCPGSCGWLRLISRAQARAEGFADLAAAAHSLTERFPLRLEGEPVPRIREGALCLSDPEQAQVCLATFQVSARLEAANCQCPAPDLAMGQPAFSLVLAPSQSSSRKAQTKNGKTP